jgi:hypothetical protein
LFSKGQRDILNFQFVPTVESDAVNEKFLPAHPEILMKTASPVPIISGLNDLEGMIIFAGKLFLTLLLLKWLSILILKSKKKKLQFTIFKSFNVSKKKNKSNNI